MSPKTNRRNGLKHEGRVRKWFNDAGYTCLNLASNAPGDLLLYGRDGRTRLLEVKRVTAASPGGAVYYPSVNPKQRDALARIPLTFYCVSFYGLRPNQAPVTRFCDAAKLPLAIRPDSGEGWEAFLRSLGDGVAV